MVRMIEIQKKSVENLRSALRLDLMDFEAGLCDHKSPFTIPIFCNVLRIVLDELKVNNLVIGESKIDVVE